MSKQKTPLADNDEIDYDVSNAKIHKFMGYPKSYWSENNLLSYHESWDKLMPVVEKIKNIGMDRPNSMSVHVRRRLLDLSIGTPIKEVYDVVLTFIDWYETQNA